MNAKNVLLTHYSQRYPKLPTLPTGLIINIGFAFDLMTVPFSDFWKLPKYNEALSELFKDD